MADDRRKTPRSESALQPLDGGYARSVAKLDDIVGVAADYSGAMGLPFAPLAAGAVKSWVRRDVNRNALRVVRDALLSKRLPPGDEKAMKAVYASLCYQLVDPGFRLAMSDLLERGDFGALERIREHLSSTLRIPEGGDRAQLVAFIVESLQLSVGRAQKDVQAAVDIATAVHAARVLARTAELLEAHRKDTVAASRKTRITHLMDAVLARHTVFGGREPQLRALDAFIAGDDQRYAFVTGVSGYGKTALLAALTRLLLNRGAAVVYHFISRLDGLAGESVAMSSLCRQLASLGAGDE